jgi:hypothetical protein
MTYPIECDSNGCYWAKSLPGTCPVDLARRLLVEYGVEIFRVDARYWRCVPASRYDDFKYYYHFAKGPGRGAFWACLAEVKILTKQQVQERLMNPANLSARITAGLESINPPDPLLALAAEATPEGIAAASPALLQAWAADVLRVANGLRGEAGQYWAQVAADLRSLAWERGHNESNP